MAGRPPRPAWRLGEQPSRARPVASRSSSSLLGTCGSGGLGNAQPPGQVLHAGPVVAALVEQLHRHGSSDSRSYPGGRAGPGSPAAPAGPARHSLGRWSITRRILPIRTSSVSGSTTSTATLMPTPSLTRAAITAAADSGCRAGPPLRLDQHVQLVPPVLSGQQELEVRRDPLGDEHDLLDLGREDVHAPQDDHVVGAPGHLVHPPEGGPGGARPQRGQVPVR